MRKTTTHLALGFLLLAWSWGSWANETVHDYRVDLELHDIEINDDLTYTRVQTLEYTVLTPTGAEALQKYEYSYFSENESFKVLEASITTPEGKSFPVEDDNIYEQDLGGPDQDRRSREAVIIFSQLTPGSKLRLKYRHQVNKVGPMGINLAFSPDLGVKQSSIGANILLPENTELKWGARGQFKVQTESKGSRQLLRARLDDIPLPRSRVEHGQPDRCIARFRGDFDPKLGGNWANISPH